MEVLLAGATAPEPPPARTLGEADLWDQLPDDLDALLALLPSADVYWQDEVQFAFHPTLTRVWCRTGRRGQRLVEAPGDTSNRWGFGRLDWRDGWFDGRLAPGRTADVFCEQLRAAVERAVARGRRAIGSADNARTHTARGSKLVRALLAAFKDQLYLVSTPAYEPDANRSEWLWRRSRRPVTHNHHRDTWQALRDDITAHFADVARSPAAILRQIGSPASDHLPHAHSLPRAA